MTLLEAIEARHSVRNYKDEPIPEDILSILRDSIREINLKTGLHIQLVTNEPKAFRGPIAYGSFSGVSNYLVMAGKKGDDLDEKVGYHGERLVLLAQTLGLNSCWAGLSYRKIALYIALGYGQTQGNSHKVKTVREVSNASDITPKWFKRGVEAALLAPTAVNQQKFRIEFLGFKGYGGVPKVAARPLFSMIGYSKIDLGIVKCHFEIGAGKENFEWA